MIAFNFPRPGRAVKEAPLYAPSKLRKPRCWKCGITCLAGRNSVHEPTKLVMATEKMNEDWRRIRDQIKDIWDDADFDNKQMKRARGDFTKIVGLIHDKTEEPIEEIRRKMSAIL